MRHSLVRFTLCLLSTLSLAASSVWADDPATAPADQTAVSFHTQIKPIFQANCQGCHQPAKALGEYVMTDFASLMMAGETGDPAIVPGKPEQSYLYSQIELIDGVAEMPKNKPPLSPDQIALVRTWISQGAHDDTPESAKTVYDAEHPPVYQKSPVVTSLDFSPSGDLLAVSGHHEVLIHKADGSEIVSRLIGVSDRIESVRFSPDGTRLAVTGGAPARMGEVQVWNVNSGELEISVQVTYDTVYGASWSPDGSKIAFGCADNSVRVIDSTTGEEVLFQGSHSDWVLDTAFSLDGSHLVSVGRDQTAKLTEFETARFVDNLTSITPGALTGGLAAVDRHPTRDEILIGGADGIPRTYRMQRLTKRVIGDDANLVRELPSLPGRIFSVAYSPDGKQIVAGSSLNGVGTIGIYSYDVDGALPDELKKILEQRVASRKPEDKQKIADYRKQNISQTASTTIPDAGIYAVTYHPNGEQIAVGTADGQIRLIRTADASLIRQFSAVPIEPSATSIASADEDWKLGSLEPPQTDPLPENAVITSLQIQPSEIVLTKPFAYTQIVVLATLQTGGIIDVTRQTTFTFDANTVQIDGFGLMRPLADGQFELTAQMGGQSVAIPVSISGQAQEFTADYIEHVTPIMSKLGCNQGTCHGSKDGKAGFKLSLRGYDPLYDVRALTDDHASRRTNSAAPEESLMLLKAIGGVPHVGGQLTTSDHVYYQVLRNWIENGAELELDSPRVASIDIFPKNPTIQTLGSRQQVRVVATYTDGTTRDVTYESFVNSGNTEVAEINSSGLLTAVRRGEAPILARYEGSYAATTLTVMGDRTGFAWVEPPKNNAIDELVARKWERLKILPSELCTDAEFLRRVTFDLTGLPPTAEAVQSFLADPRPSAEKRAAQIDYLIGSDGYVEHFANKWADLLMVNGKFLGREGATLFREWIRNQVAENRPYDEFVADILTASGSNKANPPASYYKVLRTPEDTMENTTHLFLGVRFNCNKCHDHPFERWTQDQYYETAAFFSQYDLQRAPESAGKNIGGSAVESGKPLYENVVDKTSGEMIHQRTGDVAPPKFPYDNQIEVPADASRRAQLAEWMTDPDNDYFARSYVNRLWGYLFGVGIIEPIDDIRAGNPPTNPELLDYLTAEFIKSDFDVQHVLRLITNSRVYQLSLVSNQWNEDDQINFSHAKARRLSAEAIFDAVHLVTGAESKIPGVPAGTRAASLTDSQIKLPDGFLNSFGRPTRESACECERSNEVQLGPVMAMVSGPTIASAISDPKNALPELVKQMPENEQLINELFVRILNRPATEREIAISLKAFAGVDPSHKALVAQLSQKEAWWKPLRAEKETQRSEAIAQAEAELKAYQEKIAPRVAEQEQARLMKIEAAKKTVSDYEAAIDAPFQKWLAEQRTKPVQWHYLAVDDLKSSIGAEISQLSDAAILAKQKKGLGFYEFTAQTNLQNITAIRIEGLTDNALPRKGPGLSAGGNFVLTEFTVTAGPKSATGELAAVPLTNAKADFSQSGYDIATAIDGIIKPAGNGWAISNQTGKPHWGTFNLVTPLGHEGGTQLKFVLEQRYQDQTHWLGKFRISITTADDADPKSPGQLQRQLELVAIPDDQRTEAEQTELLAIFKQIDPQLKKLRGAVATASQALPIDPQVTALQAELKLVQQPVADDPALVQLRTDVAMSEKLLENERLTAAQDLTWVLINSPSFLFNR